MHRNEDDWHSLQNILKQVFCVTLVFRQTCKRRSQILLNLTLTIALTLLTLPTLLNLLLSTVFNMVQEFGTAVYRIASFSLV